MSFVDSLNKLLGDPNQKELKKIQPLVPKIREIAASDVIRSLNKDDLPAKTAELKQRVSDGESLDKVLPEAFATVIRACELIEGATSSLGKQTFTWKMVPYDVQLIGGIALHRGMIAEMKTGEGKTLVCTMPVYLNALTGKGVHVVTVNDYLARRDAVWMSPLYEALGLTVGTITHEMDSTERRDAYNCDVTYGTNNEFGFDYLRDNMAPSLDRQVQRPLHYALVDEVDSILIDEARTPLIISQPADESTEKYTRYAQLVSNLQKDTHYNLDEKQRTAVLTEEGVRQMEQLLGVDNIYTDRGFEEVHHIEQALRAHAVYQSDVDYVVRDGQVIIVDEFTGRLMEGRRYGHGLHQAIEAKEGVPVQRESKTLATITFQNYFRLYEKLAGMTGTAKTEEEEFESIYKTRTLVIPTHRPLARNDKSDAIYKTVQGKFQAVAKIAKEKYERGQPVLIGTTSIEKSEALSALLNREQIPHQVLNAKHHEKEAEIVADAGQKGAITIATNMAGRGTDIKLGEGVAELGGLCILGTERHEARRIDNQLRGRSGRQGDHGESQFFVSMDDDLMRLFGGDRLKAIMERLKVPEDVPLENKIVSRSIEGAQKRVEGHNFDVRKHTVQYDDVMNRHRQIIYTRRQKILIKLSDSDQGDEENPLHDELLEMLRAEVTGLCSVHAAEDDPEKWDVAEIVETMGALHPTFRDRITEADVSAKKSPEELQTFLSAELTAFYEEKCSKEDAVTVAQAERIITLRSIDLHWMDHIDDMAHLREQVAFAGYAQRDPLIEYKDQGFQRFQELLAAIDSTIVRTVLQEDFAQFAPRVFVERVEEGLENLATNIEDIEAEAGETGVAREAKKAVSDERLAVSNKVGRNEPCPCGSGKKYKKCHGR